jgi:LPXTG-site transpeptidase (sortase) family protein
VRRIIALTALFIVVLGASAAAVRLWHGTAAAPAPASAIETPPAGTAAPSPSAITSSRTVAAPARLQIPSIRVDAAVVALGLDAQGNLGVPADQVSVAWYTGSARPGEAGNAVINGHLDWTNGDSVFGRLKDLRTGDPVSVTTADGERVTFAITGSQLYPADAHPAEVFARGGPPVLRLITCGGPYNVLARRYEQRLVVTAEPIA